MVKYAPIALTGDMVVVITRDPTPSTSGQACQKQPIFITHLYMKHSLIVWSVHKLRHITGVLVINLMVS